MDNTSPLMLSVYDFFKDQGSAFNNIPRCNRGVGHFHISNTFSEKEV